ncbi:CBS domain-containing protein [Streptomyces murinus]|uniref:CBS domain-containing protein n=1 Tax=Streptomyces murinus TaxID=33900 RepID=UPI0037291CBA
MRETGTVGSRRTEEAAADAHENLSAQSEARRQAPDRRWSPGETARQDVLLRYLGAVAAAAAGHGAPAERLSARARPAPPSPTPPPSPFPEPGQPVVREVREVMDVPAAHIRAGLPYRDIARVLAREQAGALPVVDAQDHVVGVVSESDLLAKVAFEASGHRPGPIGGAA